MKEGEKGELISKAEARYTVEAYYKGFRLLLTLPFENGGAIVGILDKMAEMGFSGDRTIYQAPQLPTPETAGNGNGKETEPPICPTHNVPMVKRIGQYGEFYACPRKTQDGQWCKERPPKT